jgi:hypothetical protein
MLEFSLMVRAARELAISMGSSTSGPRGRPSDPQGRDAEGVL